MAKAVPKITLSASRDIPFNKLVLSQSNVRRTKAGISIEDLAEDIARRGLLQSLNVRPVLEADGVETSMFEIPAGGRRFRALELLVKQKRLSKTALIPCVLRDRAVAISAEEDSLAENVHRVALHPLDQFRAFMRLREQGASDEEIAARFFVSPSVVKQRLRLDGVQVELTPTDQTTVDALTAEQAKLESEYEAADELPAGIDARLGEIETALATFEDRPARYEPVELARAGVFVSIDPDGHLSVDRGYVRPEDEPQIPVGGEDPAEGESRASDGMASTSSTVQRTVITIGGEQPDDDDDAIKPLPERLVGELTAYRTLALRDAVANNPRVALTLLLHKLCLDTFQHCAPGACLEASVRHVFFPVQAADLKDSPSAKAIAERHEAWKAELPKDDHVLWDWLDTLEETRRTALLAHCVSFGVNALYEKGDRYGGPGISANGVRQRIAQADRLARAVDLDMVDAGWRPTVDNYLGRVTKPRILEAVREAKGDQAAQLIDHLKKAEMAKEGERLLDGTGWLPEPLRLADSEDVSVTAAKSAGELPAFLADGEGNAATGESEPHPIAAE